MEPRNFEISDLTKGFETCGLFYKHIAIVMEQHVSYIFSYCRGHL